MSRKINVKLAVKVSVLFALIANITACKTTPDSKTAFSCGCSSYFPDEIIDTQLFSREIISADVYQASGSTYCTGLKELDVETADNKAKENLAKLISVNVETKESVTIGNAGYGVIFQEYTQSSNLESKLTVQGAYIIQRWVDATHCTINSSARVSKDNADLSLASVTKSIKQSTFYIKSSGNEVIDNMLFEYFVEQGIGNISDQDSKQKYRIEASVVNALKSSEKSVKLTLNVKILNRENGEVFASINSDGKGVSYNKLTYSELYNRALYDALIEIRTKIVNLLKDQ